MVQYGRVVSMHVPDKPYTLYICPLPPAFPNCSLDYDGGDCCSCTCNPENYLYGDDGCTDFACVDPEAECVDDDDVTAVLVESCGYFFGFQDGYCHPSNNNPGCGTPATFPSIQRSQSTMIDACKFLFESMIFACLDRTKGLRKMLLHLDSGVVGEAQACAFHTSSRGEQRHENRHVIK